MKRKFTTTDCQIAGLPDWQIARLSISQVKQFTRGQKIFYDSITGFSFLVQEHDVFSICLFPYANLLLGFHNLVITKCFQSIGVKTSL